MAWRPSRYLLEGELDNTVPGKVAGWMRFAGMQRKVTFDLKGDFHRDIRGTKIRFRADPAVDADPGAVSCMKGLGERQCGDVGDMTAGLPPQDYVDYPYFEWYSECNGRVVLELDTKQIDVIGTPIPARESDPVSRNEQAQHMASFLAGLSAELNVPAITVSQGQPFVSDPRFTHWVVELDQIIGEAHSVKPASNGLSFAFVRLFAMPEMGEYGDIESSKLLPKS